MAELPALYTAVPEDPHVRATAHDPDEILSMLSDYRVALKRAADAGIEVAVSGTD